MSENVKFGRFLPDFSGVSRVNRDQNLLYLFSLNTVPFHWQWALLLCVTTFILWLRSGPKHGAHNKKVTWLIPMNTIIDVTEDFSHSQSTLIYRLKLCGFVTRPSFICLCLPSVLLIVHWGLSPCNFFSLFWLHIVLQTDYMFICTPSCYKMLQNTFSPPRKAPLLPPQHINTVIDIVITQYSESAMYTKTLSHTPMSTEIGQRSAGNQKVYNLMFVTRIGLFSCHILPTECETSFPAGLKSPAPNLPQKPLFHRRNFVIYPES